MSRATTREESETEIPSEVADLVGGGGGTRTCDLRIMSPKTSVENTVDAVLNSANRGKVRQNAQLRFRIFARARGSSQPRSITLRVHPSARETQSRPRLWQRSELTDSYRQGGHLPGFCRGQTLAVKQRKSAPHEFALDAIAALSAENPHPPHNARTTDRTRRPSDTSQSGLLVR
jgi:hypothetical protein